MAPPPPQTPPPPPACDPNLRVEFSTNRLTITDKIREFVGGPSFEVWLNRAPTKDVTVHFDSPYLSLSVCFITFTPQNWNQRRSIQITPAPYYPGQFTDQDRADQFVTAKLDTGCAQANKMTVAFRTRAGAICSVWGDPHFRTFDGKDYVFQGVDKYNYWLIKSPMLEVQIRVKYSAFGNAATKVYEVGVRYQQSVFKFVEGSTPNNYDQKATIDMTPIINDPRDNVRVSRSPANDQIKLKLPDGSEVEVTRYDDNRREFTMSVKASLSGYFFNQNLGGLCGNFNGNGNDDPNGGWNIPYENCIVLGQVKIPDTVAIQEAKVCHARRRLVDESMISVDALSQPQQIVRTLKSGPSQKRINFTKVDAVHYCSSVVPDSPCNHFVEKSNFVDACAMDVVILGAYQVSTSTREIYQHRCHMYATSTIEQGIGTDRENAKATMDYLKSLSGCSGRGTWREWYCDCNEGFQGASCAVDLTL